MSTAAIVTSGYSTGLYAGTIADVVTWGYSTGVSTSLQAKEIEAFNANTIANNAAGLPSIAASKISTGVVTR